MRWMLPLLVASAAGAAPSKDVADVIYFGGPVETLDADFARADALALKDGRILAVGTTGAVLRHSGPGTRHVDLGGRALLPGFVDAHTHLLNGAPGVGLTFEEGQQLGLQNGITAIGDLFVGPDAYDAITDFAASGQLRIRTSMYLVIANNCGLVVGDGTWYLAHPPIRDPEALLRIPGVKIFTDGGSCGRAANTFENIPPGDPPFGDLWWEQAAMDGFVAQADAAGYQVAVHALGDRGRDVAVTAIDHALAGRANVLRHRIEHDSFMRPDQIAAYQRLGIVSVPLSPAPTCFEVDDPIEQYLPDFALPWYHPLPSEFAAGLPIAWSIDWPYRPIDTLRFHLYHLVTRASVRDDGVTVCEPTALYAALAVTVRQALRMMTLGAAYALHMDSAIGSLEPGKVADLIVLSADPLAVEADALKDVTVLSTVIGGAPVYCAPGSEALCTSTTAATGIAP